jgi:hypothetical protein
MIKENSSFEILSFAFVRWFLWIRCWFLPRAEVDSSPFVKSFGTW